MRVASLRAARAVSAFLALCVLAGSGLAYTYLNRLTSQAGTAASIDEIEGNVADDPKAAGEAMDILMIGTDGRDGTDIPDEEDGGLHNTDTMMLIHVPADGSKASIVSFPRDSYVQLPNGEYSKLNAAYAYGYNSLDAGVSDQDRKDAGQTNLIQTINILSGVQIDHFVEITLAGFKDLTRAIGGVDVNLCEAVDEPKSGANFPAGPQHLDENQALAFVRQRHQLPNGDLDRIKRQQYFMGAMIRSVLSQDLLDLFNIDKLTTLIDALAGTINYDPSLDLLELAEQMRDIAAGNVEFRTIPVLADDTVPGIGDVLVIADEEEMKEFFAALNNDADKSEASPSSESSSTSSAAPDIDPATIPVDVYDGSQSGGLVDQTVSTLTAAGFPVQNIGVAQTSDYAITEVHYPTGMEAQAAVVAAAIPGAALQVDDTAPEGKVLVVVGEGASADTGSVPEPDAPDSTAADTNCIY